MSTQPENLDTPVTTETTSSKRDFWMGFIGWWVFNLCTGGLQAALIFGIPALASDSTTDYSTIINTLTSGLGCLVLLANIGALIFFAFRRKQIALGMLVAFGVSIAISILLGIVAMAFCFYIISQYNNL